MGHAIGVAIMHSPSLAELGIRPATPADLPALHALVERCYRGSANTGWTHEGHLFDGPRTDVASLAEVLATPGQAILVADAGAGPLASVQIRNAGKGIGYLGLLCVDPAFQGGGLAKRMIAAAEVLAAHFGATMMEMTVINHRPELIAYYQRRGYALTGDIRYLPAGIGQLRDDISLLVLAKPIGPPV